MKFTTALGNTGIEVSALGLGTVKLGRNEGVKYPSGFELPDDASVSRLLQLAADAGINLLDTAPAYGSSEERIGKLSSYFAVLAVFISCLKLSNSLSGSRQTPSIFTEGFDERTKFTADINSLASSPCVTSTIPTITALLSSF